MTLLSPTSFNCWPWPPCRCWCLSLNSMQGQPCGRPPNLQCGTNIRKIIGRNHVTDLWENDFKILKKKFFAIDCFLGCFPLWQSPLFLLPRKCTWKSCFCTPFLGAKLIFQNIPFPNVNIQHDGQERALWPGRDQAAWQYSMHCWRGIRSLGFKTGSTPSHNVSFREMPYCFWIVFTYETRISHKRP